MVKHVHWRLFLHGKIRTRFLLGEGSNSGKRKRKIMKKLLALLLAVLMSLSLAACGSGSSSTSSAASGSAAASGSGSAASSAAASFTTIEKGKLIMSTNAQFPPYETVADDGKGYENTGFEGIDIELAYALAQKLKLKLMVDNMDFDSALSAVQQGKSDVVLAGLTVNADRLVNMNFTDSYANGVQVVIVPDKSSIKTIDDLKDKMIGTQRGTTGYLYCTDDYGEDHVTAFDDGATAVQNLLAGKVDAVVIDNDPAQEYVQANPGLTILDTAYTNEDYAIGVGKSNTALLSALNTALSELKADGTVQSILDKYIPSK